MPSFTNCPCASYFGPSAASPPGLAISRLAPIYCTMLDINFCRSTHHLCQATKAKDTQYANHSAIKSLSTQSSTHVDWPVESKYQTTIRLSTHARCHMKLAKPLSYVMHKGANMPPPFLFFFFLVFSPKSWDQPERINPMHTNVTTCPHELRLANHFPPSAHLLEEPCWRRFSSIYLWGQVNILKKRTFVRSSIPIIWYY